MANRRSDSNDNYEVDLYSVSRAQRRTRKKKRNVPRIVFNIFMSLVLVFSILTVSGTYVLGLRPLDQATEEETAENLEELTYSASSGVSYILVVGVDVSESLTDIIMVACVDHDKHTLNILQIPRDTFVGTDVNTGKINAVYGSAKTGEAKINALRRRLTKQLGIPLDHYVIFTLTGFRNCVDALGGVPINITQSGGITIQNHVTGANVHLDQGEQLLDGILAEGFVRKRYGSEKGYGLGDISRVQQQRVFYAALAKKLTEMNASEMLKVVKNCYSEVSTSMSVSEMLSYAKEMKSVSLSEMQIMTVPGQFCNYRSLSYYSIHKDEYITMFNTYFNPYGDAIKSSDISIPELHTLIGQATTGSVVSTGGTLSEINDANGNS